MTNPTYDAFIPPLLVALAAHPRGIRAGDAYGEVADAVGLTEEDRLALLPSGRQPIYENRICWAHDRLKRAGYSQSLQRGLWQLTESGRAFAAAHPRGLDRKTVEALAMIAKTSKVADGLAVAKARSPEPVSLAHQSPEERIEEAIGELNESLSRDLLAMIAAGTPAFFERLVLDLLLAMGYGATRDDLQQVGKSGDAGIDGIIALDRLGLEKVHVQAKRWKATIGRPEIQGFYGALAGKRARKGVFITTSDFSREAKEYAQQVSESIVLVGGERLAELMIAHGVGVTRRPVQVARVDGDYFEDG